MHNLYLIITHFSSLESNLIEESKANASSFEESVVFRSVNAVAAQFNSGFNQHFF